MTDTLTLASSLDLNDLQTFLQRADRLGCDRVRLQVIDGVVLATVCVLEKEGLLDASPFVLGLRSVSGVPSTGDVDLLAETRAVCDRVARGDVSFALPPSQPRVPWLGSTPPRSGWAYIGDVSSADLVRVAHEGIAEVSQASGRGALIVAQVRRTVWARPIGPLPAGAAFAALGLGFVSDDETDEPVRITAVDAWLRATTRRGVVLVRA